MGLKIKIDEVDFELQKDYADCLDKPLAQLKKHKTAKKSLCEKLEKWLITDDEQSLKLIIDVIVQLSHWCHTSDNPKNTFKKNGFTALHGQLLLLKLFMQGS